MKNITFNPTNKDENLSFTIQQAPNGGFVVWQKNIHAGVMDTMIGAFTDAKDVLAALSAYFIDDK